MIANYEDYLTLDFEVLLDCRLLMEGEAQARQREEQARGNR